MNGIHGGLFEFTGSILLMILKEGVVNGDFGTAGEEHRVAGQ